MENIVNEDDPEYYPRIRYDNKWLVMAPEIRKNYLRSVTDRCHGCEFIRGGDAQCHKAVKALEKRGVDCTGREETDDSTGIPAFIYVWDQRWHEYIAARVAERMTS
jgi:hypothetical protein